MLPQIIHILKTHSLCAKFWKIKSGYDLILKTFDLTTNSRLEFAYWVHNHQKIVDTKWRMAFFQWVKKPWFWQHALQPLGIVSHMATYRSFSKYTKKNWIYNSFQTLNYSWLMQNWNWVCLVLPQKACEKLWAFHNSPLGGQILKSKSSSSYKCPSKKNTTFGQFRGLESNGLNVRQGTV
jgi:hypothetical protein